MTMTHYMELLASNQPFNLIIYMAIPVILAETIAISELYLLYTRKNSGFVKNISVWSGIIAGFYFLGIFINLFFSAVVPLTQNGEWRGPFDVIAVISYLLGVVPLMGIALLELGVVKRNASVEEKRKLHAILVAVFLVIAHIAMIFGMLNPDLTSTEKNIEVEHSMDMH